MVPFNDKVFLNCFLFAKTQSVSVAIQMTLICCLIIANIIIITILIIFRGEICNKEVGNLTLCPECPKFCDFRSQGILMYSQADRNVFKNALNPQSSFRVLKDSCQLYRLAWVFDHSLTPLFALFMSIWGEIEIVRGFFLIGTHPFLLVIDNC